MKKHVVACGLEREKINNKKHAFMRISNVTDTKIRNVKKESGEFFSNVIV